jgi:lipopolysaccharide export system permease protein
VTLLDRSIARNYLTNILFLFAILFVIIFLIDFSLNFDEFQKGAVRVAQARGVILSSAEKLLQTVVIAFTLWWPRFFQLFHYLLGFVLVCAMGFTCTQMVKHRELVAMLAGGLSLHRVARPILLVALSLTALQAVNREVFVPRLAPLLTRQTSEIGQNMSGQYPQPLIRDTFGRLYYAKTFNLAAGTLSDVWIWECDPEGVMTRRITADRADYRSGAWFLTNGKAQPVDRTPGTAASPIQTIDFVPSDVDPTMLRVQRFEGYSLHLSWTQLDELITRYQAQVTPVTRRIEEFQRLQYGRVATYAANLLVLLLCMPFFLRREPSNMLTQAVKCAPVAMIALVGALFGTMIAVPGFPPQISVFLPVMALTPITVAAVSGIRT